MLSKVFVNLSQAGRNTRTEQIRRLVDRVVNAGRGVRRSPTLRRRGICGSCTGSAGDSMGGRAAGKDLHEYVREMVITRKTSGLANQAREMLVVRPLPRASDGKDGSNTRCLRRFGSGV
jgi:hypothetical protein